MLHLIPAFLAAIRVFFRNRVDTSLEVLALRQQVAVLKRKRPRPSLNRLDRFFWTALRHIWPRWSDVLVIVKPETVVGWHRAGFRLYGETQDYNGVVSPDGRVAFTYAPGGAPGDIYVKLARGAGPPEPLVKSGTVKHPNHWSLDGRFLIYDEHTKQQQDLWIVPMAGDRKPIPFLVTPTDETFGQFSPDTKWIAYSSDESGRREVYVQGFVPDHVPAAGIGKWQISTAGGDEPRWRRDGKELFYIAPDKKMMAVPVKSTATTFELGAAIPLFETHVTGFLPYDVAPDGRFLLNTVMQDAAANTSPITVVLNWTAGLRK